jgi:hypothetical protein
MNYDPTDPDKMRLPVGVTCGDCRHIGRCKAMFGHVEEDTYCDWSPRGFSPTFLCPQRGEDRGVCELQRRDRRLPRPAS